MQDPGARKSLYGGLWAFCSITSCYGHSSPQYCTLMPNQRFTSPGDIVHAAIPDWMAPISRRSALPGRLSPAAKSVPLCCASCNAPAQIGPAAPAHVPEQEKKRRFAGDIDRTEAGVDFVEPGAPDTGRPESLELNWDWTVRRQPIDPRRSRSTRSEKHGPAE